MRLPGGRAAGRRSPELVGNLDIAPTILDALGMPRPAAWTGRSFLPGIEAPEAWRGADSIVIEAPREKEVSVRTPAWMYREMAPGVADDADDGDGPAPWRRRFGYRPDESEQLFDLAVDPLEHANVAAARRDEVQRMKTVADAFLAAKPPMLTWSSRFALDGMESTLAGWQSTLFSDTSDADATCAIM